MPDTPQTYADAERRRLRAMTAYTVGFGHGASRQHVYGAYEAVRALEAKLARHARMEGVLARLAGAAPADVAREALDFLDC